MCGHLWYLGEEAVGLAFFDNNIPLDVKVKMVEAFKADAEGTDHCHFRNVIQPKFVDSFENKTLDYFVTKKTVSFFKRFQISTEFLDFESGKLTVRRNVGFRTLRVLFSDGLPLANWKKW